MLTNVGFLGSYFWSVFPPHFGSRAISYLRFFRVGFNVSTNIKFVWIFYSWSDHFSIDEALSGMESGMYLVPSIGSIYYHFYVVYQ